MSSLFTGKVFCTVKVQKRGSAESVAAARASGLGRGGEMFFSQGAGSLSSFASAFSQIENELESAVKGAEDVDAADAWGVKDDAWDDAQPEKAPEPAAVAPPALPSSWNVLDAPPVRGFVAAPPVRVKDVDAMWEDAKPAAVAMTAAATAGGGTESRAADAAAAAAAATSAKLNSALAQCAKLEAKLADKAKLEAKLAEKAALCTEKDAQIAAVMAEAEQLSIRQAEQEKQIRTLRASTRDAQAASESAAAELASAKTELEKTKKTLAAQASAVGAAKGAEVSEALLRDCLLIASGLPLDGLLMAS